MTLYTETPVAGELVLEPRHRSISQFWRWREKGGEALETADPSIRFLNFAEQAAQEQNAVITYGTSFTTLPRGEKKRVAVVIPPLEDINMHHPALTSKVRYLLRNFWAIIVSKALQTYFPIGKTSIAVFSDTSEDRLQVVLRVLTEASASQAVAFWESLESDIHEWVSRLNDRDRLIFLRDISLRIHWQ